MTLCSISDTELMMMMTKMVMMIMMMMMINNNDYYSYTSDYGGSKAIFQTGLIQSTNDRAQYGAPFVNLLFISLLVVFFVICSFIYDNFITDCPFSQRSNFTIIGCFIKPFLYLLVI